LKRLFPFTKEFAMKPNVGNVDRILRIVVGLLLVAGALTGLIGLWGWIGVVLIATGVFRFCLLYLPFGLNTCRRK
jgi:uncharacterized membrane protein HdeD (DUF308 family)